MDFDALAIGLKFLFYLSSFQACGLALGLVVFNSDLAPQASICTRHMRRWVGLCAISAIGVVANASLAIFDLGGIDLVLDYLKSTGYAAALIVQLIACATMFFGGIIAAVAAVFLLGSFALVGHIGPSVFANVLVLHLIFGSVWFAILAPLRRMAMSVDHNATARLGRGFGRLAQGFAPVSLLLGGVLAWSVSSSLSALISTPYGFALITKVLCSAGLLWAGAANKLRYVPGIEAQDDTAAAGLAKSVRIEWWLFIVILGLTATLTTTMTPP